MGNHFRKKLKCVSDSTIDRKISANPKINLPVRTSPAMRTEKSTPEGLSSERSSEPVAAARAKAPDSAGAGR